MKEIRYILILAIGCVLFWVGTVLIVTQLRPPPSDWRMVIPSIEGSGLMNLTTSTFNITGEKWSVGWYAAPPDPAQCFVEVYNASTDEKLQEFTLYDNYNNYTKISKELNITGSFYLKIQVSGNKSWSVRVRVYKPPPRFPTWIPWIAVIGITSLVAFFGYKKLRRK